MLDKADRFLQCSPHMKTTTFPLKHSVNRFHCQLALLIPLALACFALSPQARATCQNGCDTSNGNTFLGDDALSYNTTGADNTAIGFQALNANTTGGGNTATGDQALYLNTTGFSNTANGVFALNVNTTGSDNTASGSNALAKNTTSRSNP